MVVANGDEGNHSYEDKYSVSGTGWMLVAVIVTMAFLLWYVTDYIQKWW